MNSGRVCRSTWPGAFHLGRRLGAVFFQNHHQSAGLLRIKTVTTPVSRQTQVVPGGVCREVLQSRFQTTLICSAEGDDLYITLPVCRSFERLVFLEQAMEVAAAETERTDTGPAGMIAPGNPWPCFGVDIEWRGCRGDGILRSFDFDGWRQVLL